MKRYLLDTSALLTLRDDEAGAEQVAELLQRAGQEQVSCKACFVTLMEVLFRVWKDEGQAAGRFAYEQCRDLPIEWVHESPQLLEKAGEVKATHRLSLADAWIGASALIEDATLVHKAPEFEALACLQQVLLYK